MYEFSSVTAAFRGFGIVQRDPLTFLGVTALFTGLAVLLAMSFLPAYATLLEASIGHVSQQEEFEAMMAYLSSVGWVTLASFPIAAVAMGALYRANVFGQSRGWFLGLKLGMDELRAFVVTLIVVIVAMIPYLLGYLVGVIIGVGVATAGDNAALGIFIGVIGFIVGACLSLWIGVRLTPAAAASVGEGRFVIFEAWGMTKGRFWSIFGAYFLLYLVLFAAYIVIAGGIFAFTAGSMATGALGEAANNAPSDPEQMIEDMIAAMRNVKLGPIMIAGSVLYGVVYTFITSAWYGIGAEAYRTLGGGAQRIAEASGEA